MLCASVVQQKVPTPPLDSSPQNHGCPILLALEKALVWLTCSPCSSNYPGLVPLLCFSQPLEMTSSASCLGLLSLPLLCFSPLA